jgi:cell division protein FtsI/penicillin-binding protein 2
MKKTEGASARVKKILQLLSLSFLMIALRAWHLSVVQRNERQTMAEQPKRRTIVEKANRGVITDRFQIPLAVNKICYNALVYYNQIAQIPATAWRDDGSGKKVRQWPRREYIRQLSEELAPLLKLDAGRIEDLIHSKASLFPHVPFLLKSGLTEEEHFRLALLEKDWIGLHTEIGSERFYPRGKSGAEVIGSMGAISSKQYLAIADEISLLQNIIESWEQGEGYELPEGFSSFDALAMRYQELKEKAYTLQDLVGKSGVEAKFEQQLRGFYGKKITEVDQKGRFLRELVGGRPAIAGQQVSLTLSIELQEFAEGLLAEHEAKREGRSLGFDPETKERKALKQPWIKGGSIVALDPKTGEVLALASTPRFDPNDFIPSSNAEIQERKQRNLSRWLENDRLIGEIWDGRQDLLRERYSPKRGFYNEARPLTWEFYLNLILPENGPLATFFQRVDDVKTAIQIQEDVEAALFHANLRDPKVLLERPRTGIDRLDELLRPLPLKDRIFAVDLCRLVVHAPAFTDESLKRLGPMKLGQYRALNQAMCRLEANLKQKAFLSFRKEEFRAWRDLHQKTYLADIRKQEKASKQPARPYLDALDRKEKELFQEFWKECRLDRLAEAAKAEPAFQSMAQEEIKGALHTFRSFADLTRPLLGSYRTLRKKQSEQFEMHLASSFYPIGGFGFSRSYAFQAGAPQGSIFKLVTAYAALAKTGGENPLTLIDEVKKGPKLSVASTPTGVPYPRMYKGGRLPKSANPHIGKVDLVGALEQTSNPYFSILAGDILQDPEDLNTAALAFGFGAPTGIDLPGEGRGKLPTDLQSNRTGLYSMAIGQHTLLVTPLQTAVLVGTIANGGNVLRPILVKETAGALPNRDAWNALGRPPLCEDELNALGIFFPLFTAAGFRAEENSMKAQEMEIVRKIDLPPSIREAILEGMDRVIWGTKGTARPGVIHNAALLPQYLALRHQMVGKTGTAEILFHPHINPSSSAAMYKHIWFAALSFEENQKRLWDSPELVVIIYLRYGGGGREAAPLAAQMIHKWREIKNKRK